MSLTDGHLGVKAFAREQLAREEEPRMPVSQMQTVRFPARQVEEQRHGGRAARGAGRPITNPAVLAIGAVRVSSPTEPPGRQGAERVGDLPLPLVRREKR